MISLRGITHRYVSSVIYAESTLFSGTMYIHLLPLADLLIQFLVLILPLSYLVNRSKSQLLVVIVISQSCISGNKSGNLNLVYAFQEMYITIDEGKPNCHYFL